MAELGVDGGEYQGDAGLGAVRYPQFATIEDVVVAVFSGGRLEGEGV